MEKYDVSTKRPIGRGAFGAVSLYRRRTDQKEIVIKEITIEGLMTEDRKGVMNEIDVFKRIPEHPNIVQYLESFVSDNCFMIVMDYSPGGNLHEYLQVRLKEDLYLKEEEVIRYFVQTLRALHHIHKHNILHRDMKTQNILLNSTKEFVKICDFGISKHLTQTANAKTQLGTAHYMSPEVVKNEAYNKKSDVWSLGCILYELLSLKRAFDGETLVSILKKIIECDFRPMPEFYSDEINQLTKDMLCVDPVLRPDLETMLASPFLINEILDLELDIGRLKPGKQEYKVKKKSGIRKSNGTTTTNPKSSSSSRESSKVFFWTSRRNFPITLPIHGSGLIASVCAGRTKKIGLTSKGRVLVWENKNSAAGSLHLTNNKELTSMGEWVAQDDGNYSGHNISQVCCGDRFIVVRTDRGTVLTCGSGEHGCLGDGKARESKKAVMVEDLLCFNVIQVACGACHVLALTNDNQLYAWGKGSFGNLGLNDREDRLVPTQVPFSCEFRIQTIVCGSNNSFLITPEGVVWACGNNRGNKLASLSDEQLESYNNNNRMEQQQQQQQQPPQQADLPDSQVFREITCAPIADKKIVSIGSGPRHTAFLTASGTVFMAGSNKYGQLGEQVIDQQQVDLRPRYLECSKQILHVGCGDTYTIAVTEDNKLYCWGNIKDKSASGEDTTGGEQQGGPVEICYATSGSRLVRFHSLSVYHYNTLLTGQVVND